MPSPIRPLAFALAAALAAAPALGAQTPATQPPATTGGAMSQRGTAADTGLVAQLDSVNTAAKAGLTKLPASVAVPLIQSIETKLQASGRPALRSIARDLTALRTELGAATVSGPRVGAILRRVGPKVTTAAATQSGMVRTTLREIGRELTAAGRQLAAAR